MAKNKILKHDTNGAKGLLEKGEFGYDDYPSGGDAGRVWVGDGAANIALAKKDELDAVVQTPLSVSAVVKGSYSLASTTARLDNGVISYANGYDNVSVNSRETFNGNLIPSNGWGIDGTKYLKKIAGVDAPVRVDVAPVFGEVSDTSDYYLNGLWYDSTGTVYSSQSTYLNHNGKLVGFEVANGDVVDLHYDIDYPKIVEDAIQVDTMIADEYKGKNACTAWVNFDGTTTPPTIRDSFNVSDVIRIGNGYYQVYFNENMSNTSYSLSGMTRASDDSNISSNGEELESFYIITEIGTINTNFNYVSIQIFGGKE